jgi:predicted phosphodiesterase
LASRAPRIPAGSPPPRYGRIGLIGDIHAEDALLEQALDFLGARGVELIVATGDVADGPGSVDRCCDLLEARRVIVVRGNHDRCLVAGTARDLPHATAAHALAPGTLQRLSQLPITVELDTVAGRALLCHGLGHDDLGKVDPEEDEMRLPEHDDLGQLIAGLGPRPPRWILNGHSHRRMVHARAGVTVINAGTLRRDHEPCFFEIDFHALAATVFDFDGAGRIDDTGVRIDLRAGYAGLRPAATQLASRY